MEPISLWMCSCEVLTHFWREFWLLAAGGRGHVSTSCVAEHLTGSQWGWDQEMMQAEAASTNTDTQQVCGAEWTEVFSSCRRTWCAAQFSLSNTWHHESQEPKCGVCLRKMTWVDISLAGLQKSPCDPWCYNFWCLTAGHRAQDKFLSNQLYLFKMFLFHQYIYHITLFPQSFVQQIVFIFRCLKCKYFDSVQTYW